MEDFKNVKETIMNRIDYSYSERLKKNPELKKKMYMAIFLIFLALSVASAEDECLPKKCGDSGPTIRFPFWLKNHQPPHCGYPDFEISCSNINTTDFELQLSVKASTNNIMIPLKIKVEISSIDYEAQTLLTSDVNTTSCFPEKVPDVNSSTSSFNVVYFRSDYTFFNCSNYKPDSSFPFLIKCLNNPGHSVYAFPSDYKISSLPTSCYKMYNITNVPDEILENQDQDRYSYRRISLHWSSPFCGDCEKKEKYCRLKSNATGNEIECHNIPNQQPNYGASKKLVVSGILITLLLTML